MERIGKIVQIIKEEKYSGHGFLKCEGCDYLNIRPAEEREPKKNIKNLMYLFGICFIIIGGFAMGSHSLLLGWLTFLSFVGTAACVIYNDNYIYKNVPKGYWYFEPPVPVKKPYDFKLGDIVEIEVNIKKR